MAFKGTVATLPPLPPASVDAGFDDLIENLDGAIMLQAEARKGRAGVFVDILYSKLSAYGSTPGALFSGVSLDVEMFAPTLMGYYRMELQPGATLDLMAGARDWYVSTEVGLGAGLLPGRSGSESESWVDPVVAARANIEIANGLYVPLYADIGGFGVGSDLTWQAFGGAAYRFNQTVSATLGYRHLEVDYEKDGFVWDVSSFSGPVIRAMIRSWTRFSKRPLNWFDFSPTAGDS
jgi:hypothetical protein